MTAPRVLHLITRFLRGGAEKTTTNTLEALTDAEQEYDLRLGVGASYDPERLAAVDETGVDTMVFDSIRHYNPVSAVLAVAAVARYLRTEEIDLLHTHSTEAGIIGRFAAQLAGVPVVVHEVHGDPITSDRNPLLNASILQLERVAARSSTVQIVKSEHIERTYLDRGIGTPDQYRTIYHGVELDDFRTATPNREEDVPVVLFAGRLSSGKGLNDLLDAVGRLREETAFKLLVAGDGPLSDDLTARVEREGLGNVVELLGYRNDVPELMAAADVFVLPSYREGTPRVITEALAAGTPVIATNIAGIPEQVADAETGYLVEPGDIDAFVDRLHLLLTDRDVRASMSGRAESSVAKFDVMTARRTYRELYDELLDEE